MTKAKPATLTGGLVFPSKGEGAVSSEVAKPVEVQPPAIVQEAAAPVSQEVKVPKPEKIEEDEVPQTPQSSAVVLATKSITVKVDLVTYNKLKMHGLNQNNKTNQDIFTEGLGLYFKKYGIK